MSFVPPALIESIELLNKLIYRGFWPPDISERHWQKEVDKEELIISTALVCALKTFKNHPFDLALIKPKLSKFYLKGHFRAFCILLTNERDVVDLKGH